MAQKQEFSYPINHCSQFTPFCSYNAAVAERVVWTLNGNGEYIVKSAWYATTVAKPPVSWYNKFGSLVMLVGGLLSSGWPFKARYLQRRDHVLGELLLMGIVRYAQVEMILVAISF